MSVLCKKRHRLYSVIILHENGTQEAAWVPKSSLTPTMFVPVVWSGEPAELHFWDYRKKSSINNEATRLFGRPDFVIRGRALIMTGNDLFFSQKVHGSKLQVERQLSGLGLSEAPIVRPMRTVWNYQNVYARNENDAFAIRMRLA